MHKIACCPLPACASEDVELKRLRNTDSYWLQCNGCNLETGLYTSRDDLLKLWNTRDVVTSAVQ